MRHDLRPGTCVRFWRSADAVYSVQGGIVALTFDEYGFPTYTIVSHAEEDDGRRFEHVRDGMISQIVDDSCAHDPEG